MPQWSSNTTGYLLNVSLSQFKARCRHSSTDLNIPVRFTGRKSQPRHEGLPGIARDGRGCAPPHPPRGTLEALGPLLPHGGLC